MMAESENWKVYTLQKSELNICWEFYVYDIYVLYYPGEVLLVPELAPAFWFVASFLAVVFGGSV